MPERPEQTPEATYPLRAAARLTGLSPALLRAWERRYAVVEPLRTPGGTRRYRAAEIERLQLVKAAVDAGHRIGEVARLDAAELRRRALRDADHDASPLGPVLTALGRLDAIDTQRRLAVQLAALGPAKFSRDVALPLLHEVGERWADGRWSVAHEHLASAVLRSLLGAALQPTALAPFGATILFATPSGERHEFGLLTAAVAAQGAGANPIYLGADVPVDDMIAAARGACVAVVALGVVGLGRAPARAAIRALRDGLDARVRVWVGGAGARGLRAPNGVEIVDDLEELERRIVLLDGARTRHD